MPLLPRAAPRCGCPQLEDCTLTAAAECCAYCYDLRLWRVDALAPPFICSWKPTVDNTSDHYADTRSWCYYYKQTSGEPSARGEGWGKRGDARAGGRALLTACPPRVCDVQITAPSQ